MAQAALKLKYLNNLETALSTGDVASAKTALEKAAQAYSITLSDSTDSSNSSSTSTSSTSIPDDFQSIYNALNNNDLSTAKTAWSQLKSDLYNAGVTSLNAGALAEEAQLSLKAQTDEAVISTLGTALSSATDNLTTALSNWLTYNETGGSSSSTSSSGTTLDTEA